MYVVGGHPGRRADGVVVGVFGVRKMQVPIVLQFVSDHGEHQGHGVVDAFDAAVGAGMVGTPGDFVDAEALIEGAREFGAELKAVVGKESNGASPQRDVAIDQVYRPCRMR